MQNTPTFRCSLSLVVFLAALAVTILIGSQLVQVGMDSWRMRDAIEVQAVIENIEEKLVRSGDGSNIETWVTYSYQFQEQQYRHRTKRLGLFGSSDELKEEVKKHFANRTPLRCLISPTYPELSLFSTEFSVAGFLASLLFPICFGCLAIIALRELLRSLPKRQPSSIS